MARGAGFCPANEHSPVEIFRCWVPAGANDTVAEPRDSKGRSATSMKSYGDLDFDCASSWQRSDANRRTGVSTLLPENIAEDPAGAVDYGGLLMEVRRRRDVSGHREYSGDQVERAELRFQNAERIKCADTCRGNAFVNGYRVAKPAKTSELTIDSRELPRGARDAVVYDDGYERVMGQVGAIDNEPKLGEPCPDPIGHFRSASSYRFVHRPTSGLPRIDSRCRCPRRQSGETPISAARSNRIVPQSFSTASFACRATLTPGATASAPATARFGSSQNISEPSCGHDPVDLIVII
jgi:hypothetical protein